MLYFEGEGVKQDYAKAVKWFRKASDQNYPEAQTNLGFMYHNGKGIKQDYAKAMEWYKKACENGNQMGCDNYKILHQEGYTKF